MEERLALFVDVCQGVQHAHQKGIIHRDIKPSNILVAEEAEGPKAKVIDFGIARAVDRSLIDQEELATGLTALGTPAYMSPEALARSGDVDTRSDVYSLGVVLYELLTGVRPSRSQGGVSHDDRGMPAPRRPSVSVAAADLETAERHAHRRGLRAADLVTRIRGDLDWVVLRAIDTDPDERYRSAAALAADIRRHLTHEPVAARPPALSYRLRKFGRRHRLAVGAAAAIVVLIAGGSVGTGLGIVRARAAEREARLQAARADEQARAAEEVSAFLTDLFDLSGPGSIEPDSVTARELLDRGAERIGLELTDQPILRAPSAPRDRRGLPQARPLRAGARSTVIAIRRSPTASAT